MSLVAANSSVAASWSSSAGSEKQGDDSTGLGLPVIIGIVAAVAVIGAAVLVIVCRSAAASEEAEVPGRSDDESGTEPEPLDTMDTVPLASTHDLRAGRGGGALMGGGGDVGDNQSDEIC
jgi:hypothetical protein